MRAGAMAALAGALMLGASAAQAQDRRERGTWNQRTSRPEQAATGEDGERRAWAQRRDEQGGQRGEPRERFRMPAAPQSAPVQAPVQAGPNRAYGAERAHSYGAVRAADYGASHRGERRDDVRESRQDFRQGYRAGQHTDQRGDRAEYRQGYREGRREDWRDDHRDQQHAYARGYRAGDRSDNGYGRDHRRWDNRGWRNDNRYDWYRYRAAHRSLFSIGRYYAPLRGYSYNRISIGVRLGSPFYSSRYWINDPGRYRLPDVYGPYRWIRYYNDALLIDVYSGEVVDAIHNFFW